MLAKPVVIMALMPSSDAPGFSTTSRIKPSTRPMTMDSKLARTPTTPGFCKSGCLDFLLMLSPPLAF